MRLLRHLPRFQRAYRQMDTLAAREKWSRAQIEALQVERINSVWSHASTHVPYYRALRAEWGLPERFSSLDAYRQLMPVLERSVLRQRHGEFLSERRASGSWKRTGGSTGTPMSVYWEHEAHLEMLRTRYRFYATWGIDIFDRSASLWGHAASFAPGLPGLVARVSLPTSDHLRNRLRLSAYRLAPHDLRQHLRRLNRFKPVTLYGYSRAIYLLALEAEACGIRCDSLRLCVLTAEPSPPHVVAKIESVFGTPAVTEYGSTECGAIAIEGKDRHIRVREDISFVETVPRDDGRFEIVVTALNNPSFPLLRYAIADVTDAPLTVPPSGFAVLANIAGRNNDLLVTRDGGFLHAARFDAFFKFESPAIRRFHMLQRIDGAVDVSLELDRDGAVDVPSAEERISRLIGGYPVSIALVDSVPQTGAGKHRLVVSELAQARMSGDSSTSRRVPSTTNPWAASTQVAR